MTKWREWLENESFHYWKYVNDKLKKVKSLETRMINAFKNKSKCYEKLPNDIYKFKESGIFEA